MDKSVAMGVVKPEKSELEGIDFYKGLLNDGVSIDVLQSLFMARQAAKKVNNVSAEAYDYGMDESYQLYGVQGVKMQTSYLTMYLAKWRGDDAKKAKRVLNEWATTK